MANQHDPWFLHQYASGDIRLVTGIRPWENSGPTYRMSEVLRNRVSLITWTTGARKARLAYWHYQMWEYVGQHFEEQSTRLGFG